MPSSSTSASSSGPTDCGEPIAPWRYSTSEPSDRPDRAVGEPAAVAEVNDAGAAHAIAARTRSRAAANAAGRSTIEMWPAPSMTSQTAPGRSREHGVRPAGRDDPVAAAPQRADGHRQAGERRAQVGADDRRQRRADAPRAARVADELAHDARRERAAVDDAAGHQQPPPPAPGRERRGVPAGRDEELGRDAGRRRRPRTAAGAAPRGRSARGCGRPRGVAPRATSATAAPIEWPARSNGSATPAARRSK